MWVIVKMEIIIPRNRKFAKRGENSGQLDILVHTHTHTKESYLFRNSSMEIKLISLKFKFEVLPLMSGNFFWGGGGKQDFR